MAVCLFDNVRVVPTPLTIALGLAGLTGRVCGWTTPSIAGVEVIGQMEEDCAIAVQFEGQEESIWFAPQLPEVLDRTPGTEQVTDRKRLVRQASDEWVEGWLPLWRWWRSWK